MDRCKTNLYGFPTISAESEMIQVENVSRRGFLKSVVGAGAFILSVRLMPGEAFAASAGAPLSPMDAAAFHAGVYLAIDTNGFVYIFAHRSEMGNGTRTALPLIVADELEAVWKLVQIVQATGDEKYGDQDTDGSHSVRSFFDALREAGATARTMLVRAAAQQWGVPESQCVARSHYVYDSKSGAPGSGRKLFYGELVEAAAKLEVPKKEELKLKPRSEWMYMGKGASSYDLAAIVKGKASYGIDTRIRGMLYANVAHPPVFGSAVKSVDDKAALGVAGVKQTATIDAFKPPIGYQALGG